MEDWKLEPARDLGLRGMDRYQSYQREGGLFESSLRLAWWSFLRGVFRTWNRLNVVGREHLPVGQSFILAANHASHIDALLLTTLLPVGLRDQTYSIAAHDVFFESRPKAAFTAKVVNAFPVVRRSVGGRNLAELRDKLLNELCVFVLFPEGTRTRNDVMNRFKPGVGILVAGTSVPVVPCFIDGAFKAMPPNSWLLRPRRLTIRLGVPQIFDDVSNDRAGWNLCAERLEQSVQSLSAG